MELSKSLLRILVDETKYAVGKMKTASDPRDKMYYLSAVYGAANRVMNIEFDAELCFIHSVLNTAYLTINQRIAALSQQQELSVKIPPKLFERLEQALEDMIVDIEGGRPTYLSLQTISNLAYTTTGNGYYLYLKGSLPT